MTVFCSILVMVNAILPVQAKVNVSGKVLKESYSKYIVDFSSSLKKYPGVINPQNYKKVLVKHEDCIEE